MVKSSLFGRRTDDTLPTDGTNPYLNARREWNERYGSYIARAAVWRTMFLASLGVIAVLAFALQSIARQARVQPFIVQVDKLGESVATHAAEPASIPDAKVIRYQIAEAINCAKFVTPDPIVQKQCLDRLYALAGPDATAYLNDWYKKHSPFPTPANPRPAPVTVTIRTVLPLSGNTWQIDWEERAQNETGPATVTVWRAVTGLKFYTATTEADLRANPTGLIMDTLSWAQQL